MYCLQAMTISLVTFPMCFHPTDFWVFYFWVISVILQPLNLPIVLWKVLCFSKICNNCLYLCLYMDSLLQNFNETKIKLVHSGAQYPDLVKIFFGTLRKLLSTKFLTTLILITINYHTAVLSKMQIVIK